MKKLIAVVLAAILLFACGCSARIVKLPEVTPESTPQATAAPKPTPTPTPKPTATPEPTPEPTPEDYNGRLVSEGMMPLEYAERFSVELFKGGYRLISAGTGGYKYLVVPEGMQVPEGLEEGTYVLQMPITRVYMASTGMMSLVDAIGCNDRIPLVGTDKSGWYLPNVVAAMESGSIVFGGKYSEPDFEMMVDQDIQLHINTTMIDSKPEVLEKFEELGIPSLVEDSSKEGHPLARVEWVKLFGVLFGKEAEADAYFRQQVKTVEDATSESLGKTVAMGYVSSDGEKCYARNGGDYYAQMLGMAGGDYVCADMEPDKGGNSNMTFEEWYDKFKDADYLFYMNFAAKFYSIDEMVEFNPLFADFKAVKEGRVWITSADFTQSTAAIAGILQDMNTILKSDDPQNVTTDHLIKIS
jgi:iron complex transport system substrate-binding protein